MTREEVARLVAIAGRLGCSPRELLVVAARGIDAPRPQGAALIEQLHTQAGAADRVAACANLLLTSPGSYATDELDTLLASIWRTDDP